MKLTQEPDGTQELAMSDLDTEDSGKYSCVVTMETGEIITTSGQVIVAGKNSMHVYLPQPQSNNPRFNQFIYHYSHASRCLSV